jgi:protein KTI12
MALITFSGFPSSGKTRRANQLASHFEQRLADPSYAGPKLQVVILSDDNLNVDRAAYNG